MDVRTGPLRARFVSAVKTRQLKMSSRPGLRLLAISSCQRLSLRLSTIAAALSKRLFFALGLAPATSSRSAVS
jgi:hypothetical protein